MIKRREKLMMSKYLDIDKIKNNYALQSNAKSQVKLFIANLEKIQSLANQYSKGPHSLLKITNIENLKNDPYYVLSVNNKRIHFKETEKQKTRIIEFSFNSGEVYLNNEKMPTDYIETFRSILKMVIKDIESKQAKIYAK